MDELAFNQKKYIIISVSGENFFEFPHNPNNQAILCFDDKGYRIEYCVEHDKLIIERIASCYDVGDLNINGVSQEYIEPIDWEEEFTQSEKIKYQIFGEIPKQYKKRMMYGGEYLFDSVNEVCTFTGNMTVGLGFRENNDRMKMGLGFRMKNDLMKAWKYESVITLRFEDGILRDYVDESAVADKLRTLNDSILELYNEPWEYKRKPAIRSKLDEWKEWIAQKNLDWHWIYPEEYHEYDA